MIPDDYGPETYGDHIADVYDQWFPPPPQLAAAVAFVTDRKPSGTLLELGVGTGNFAIALAQAGMRVTGIDASEKMLAKLAAKAGGELVTPVCGDCAELAVPGPFDVIAAFTDSFTNLTSRQAQRQCLSAVAARLEPDGILVLEGFRRSPGPDRQTIRVAHVGIDEVVLQVADYDSLSQVVTGATVALGRGGVQIFPVRARDVSLSELDLMAELAGLTLRERWADWIGAPFGADAASYVSVYGLAARP